MNRALDLVFNQGCTDLWGWYATEHTREGRSEIFDQEIAHRSAGGVLGRARPGRFHTSIFYQHTRELPDEERRRGNIPWQRERRSEATVAVSGQLHAHATAGGAQHSNRSRIAASSPTSQLAAAKWPVKILIYSCKYTYTWKCIYTTQ